MSNNFITTGTIYKHQQQPDYQFTIMSTQQQQPQSSPYSKQQAEIDAKRLVASITGSANSPGNSPREIEGRYVKPDRDEIFEKSQMGTVYQIDAQTSHYGKQKSEARAIKGGLSGQQKHDERKLAEQRREEQRAEAARKRVEEAVFSGKGFPDEKQSGSKKSTHLSGAGGSSSSAHTFWKDNAADFDFGLKPMVFDGTKKKKMSDSQPMFDQALAFGGSRKMWNTDKKEGGKTVGSSSRDPSREVRRTYAVNTRLIRNVPGAHVPKKPRKLIIRKNGNNSFCEFTGGSEYGAPRVGGQQHLSKKQAGSNKSVATTVEKREISKVVASGTGTPDIMNMSNEMSHDILYEAINQTSGPTTAVVEKREISKVAASGGATPNIMNMSNEMSHDILFEAISQTMEGETVENMSGDVADDIVLEAQRHMAETGGVSGVGNC